MTSKHLFKFISKEEKEQANTCICSLRFSH